METSIDQRNRIALAVVTAEALYAAVNVDTTGTLVAVAYLLGEYGGQTAANICTNPHPAERFIEQTLGLDTTRMWKDYDARVGLADAINAAL